MVRRRCWILALVLLGPCASLTYSVATCQAQENADGQSAPTTAQDAKAGEKGIDNLGLIAFGSIVVAGLTIALGSIAPALGEGRAVAQALQRDRSAT